METLVVFVPFFFLIVLIVLLRFVPIRYFMACFAAGARITFFQLIAMRLRGVDLAKVVIPHIKGVKAGLSIPASDLEALLLSGGHPDKVVDGMITARLEGFNLDFRLACKLDLAGLDVPELVDKSLDQEDPVDYLVANLN